MPKITAEYTYTDEELLAILREAYAKIVSKGQEYKFQNQTFTRADLGNVAKMITDLENKIAMAASGGVVSAKVRLGRAT